MSGKGQLPEEQWRRVGMPGSLRGRRLEEINAFSPWGLEVPFGSQRGDGN